MDPLGRVLCGNAIGFGEASDVLAHIRRSIELFGTKAESLLAPDGASDLSLIGAYCARVLMETGCAAVVGRLDPFRILYLSRFQSHASYDPTRRSKSSFAWHGDVISPEKERDDELWSDTVDISKVSRALFSSYIDHIHWRPAVTMALDLAATMDPDPTLSSFMRTDSETFVKEIKGRGSLLYSHLSKGVHWEFFSVTSLSFDEQTVKQLIRDTITWVARVALISHFIPTAHCCLSGAEAFSAYSEVLERINA